MTRMVGWFVGSRSQPNQLWASAVDVATTPVSTAATVIEQRDAVEPADEPAVGRADGELAVLVQRPGDRVVAGQLAEHQRDEEHPDHGDPREPDVARARPRRRPGRRASRCPPSATGR